MNPPVFSSPPTTGVPSHIVLPTKKRGAWVFVVFMTLLPLVIAGVGLSQFWLPMHQQSQLKKTGVAATANIVNIEPTGSTYNNQPQVRLTLLVHPMQGADFTAQTKMVINPVYLPQFQPGASVKVYFDPNDHSKVAVD